MQNWTPKFPEEFQERCGYDLKKYMPAMTGKIVGNSDISDRFLWDMRRTMADMMADNYYGYIAELCHKNGIKIAAAESFTSRSQWTEYPYSLKALGDEMYTRGLNRYIFHRHALQPNVNNNIAGMTMGPWGGHFDRTNTWWNQDAAAWLSYIGRCEFILQQGNFVGDILYYEGENAPLSATNAGNIGMPSGYDYDVFGKDVLLNRLSVENGRIVTPEGQSYRLMILADYPTMTVEVARKIRDLVNAGMWVIGQKSDNSPSLINYPASNTEVQRIANEVWGNLNGTTITERSFGQGRVFWGPSVQDVLDRLQVKRDFEFTSSSGNAPINYIHRKVGDADIYFVANNGYESQELVCTFRVEGKQPEFWKADSGERINADIYTTVDGRTRMPIQLDPAGSVFVVFQSPAPATHTISVARDGATLASTELYPAAQPAAPGERGARGARGGGFGGSGGMFGGGID